VRNSSLAVRGARVVDPSQSIDKVTDVLVSDGLVQKVGDLGRSDLEEVQKLDSSGLVVCPGFVDLHCHLREPGGGSAETIDTGSAAAVRGGFTSVCCMPNTSPSLDSPALVGQVLASASEVGKARVRVIAAATKGRQGSELVDMGALTRAGVVGFSDDGSPIAGSTLMSNCLSYSSMFDRPIIQHSEDRDLAANGVMHDGEVANLLGLPGIPVAAEEVMVARDLVLARHTGGWLHVAHVSSAGAVDLIREAKRTGVRVTAEATAHHLTMTDEWVAGLRQLVGQREGRLSVSPYDPNTKVNPPLRSREHVDALLAGLADGTIDAIVTDHAPHSWVDKECEYGKAAFGINTLETALGMLMTLVHAGMLDLSALIEKLTIGPAKTFGLGGGSLRPGVFGDLVILDPGREWAVNVDTFASRSRNTPLNGCKLRGMVLATVVGGEIVWRSEQF
jgi:dihydroorotase